jgi:hypothetical protein
LGLEVVDIGMLSAWQPPQSFVPMLQGKGALSSWTPAT